MGHETAPGVRQCGCRARVKRLAPCVGHVSGVHVSRSVRFKRFQHKEATGTLKEAIAFMVLVLTENYLPRFQVDGSGVQRDVHLALQLIRKGQGGKVLLASPDPAFAVDRILPQLPAELHELAGGAVFDTADGDVLAVHMTSVCSHLW